MRQPHKHFLSENPNFCRSALSRYTPADFIALLQRDGIAFHEKHKGQLFCDRSAQDLIDLLLRECEAGGVERWQPCSVHEVAPADGGWRAQTARGEVFARQVVVATGGLPVPKIGASDWGLRLAERLGHRVVAPRDASVVAFAAMQSIVDHVWAAEGLRFPPRVRPLPVQARKTVARATRLILSGLALFHPFFFWLSAVFGGGPPAIYAGV